MQPHFYVLKGSWYGVDMERGEGIRGEEGCGSSER